MNAFLSVLGRQRNIYYVSQNLTTKWFKPVGFKGATSKMPQAKVLTVGNHSKSRVTDTGFAQTVVCFIHWIAGIRYFLCDRKITHFYF